MAAERTRTGTVTSFDDARGLGQVAGDDGEVLPFHCTAIADDTRTIEAGTTVTFAVRPGPMGRWEASSLQPA